MSQTTYDIEAPVAFAGLLADNSANEKNSISRALEDAASLPFGKPVVAGTDPETQAELPSAASQDFLGVSVHKHATEDLTDDGVAQDETFEILTQGRIWVLSGEAIAVDDPVYYQHTANGGRNPGEWYNDADGGNADLVASARWRTAAAGADALLVLELNLP